MRSFLLHCLSFVFAATTAFAANATKNSEVVRPAPDFTWVGARPHVSAKTLRGQPVVLLIADSPRSGAFRKQVKLLREIYAEFAARKVIFAAAFTRADGEIRSDIPFVTVNDGPGVAAAYHVTRGFGLMVIGLDGNLDLNAHKVGPASLVRDVIANGAAVQHLRRPDKPYHQ